MSLTLRKIKSKIRSVGDIQNIIDSMHTISTIKIKKAHDALFKAREYSENISILFNDLLPSIDRSIHPLLTEREPVNKLYIIITSDHGLCGSFNSNIISTAEKEFSYLDKDELFLICVGKKGQEYFTAKGYNVIGEYIRFFDELGYQHAMEVAKVVMDLFMLFEIDRATIIYNEYKSMIRQSVVIQQYLPLVRRPASKKLSGSMLLIPSAEDIVRNLIPKYLNIQMWECLLESYAAEQAARMMAMESSSQNAKQMLNELNLEYNKTRQNEITSELIDVVGGIKSAIH